MKRLFFLFAFFLFSQTVQSQSDAEYEKAMSNLEKARTADNIKKSIAPIIGGAMMFFGFILFRRASRQGKDVERYEFENRTDGGSLQFKDFDASIRHRRQRGKVGLYAKVGLFLMFTGLVVAIISIAIFFK